MGWRLLCLFVCTSVFSGITVALPPSGKHVRTTDDFGISVATDGTYNLTVRNDTWLRSAPTFFNMNNKTYSSGDGTLKVMQASARSGSDVLGLYQTMEFTYNIPVVATIKVYLDLPVVIFVQDYRDGASGTMAANYAESISGFPAFRVEGELGHKGVLSYGGLMAGDTNKHILPWYNGTTSINDGIAGGPLAIFDTDGRSIILSPYSNFMAASFWQDKTANHNNLNCGIMGGVNNVPANYSVQYIAYYGEGVNKAFQGYGEVMRKSYGKDPARQQEDWTIKYLGYWTDNGAYYYYNTEKSKNYEQTMLDVKDYMTSAEIPYRYLQYDSWWYYKGVGDGVKTWTSRPDVFPDGFSFVFNKTMLPSATHNRYWSSDTTYAKQNGGPYEFIVEKTKALPNDPRFWVDLFEEAKSWGLILYEQDWLNVEFSGLNALLENISLGSTWLNMMGGAAQDKYIFIQYCMANPRHVLHALQLPMVTQARVSGDYGPGREQWRIGISSIFAEALGLAPYKDTFWTTTTQPGNPYGPTRTEPNVALNAVVSTLSTGPVGPSDMVGGTNKTLLMRCCNAEGLILKPSKPARAIDRQIIRSAIPSVVGPVGEVWVAYTTISGMTFANVLAADLKEAFSLRVTDTEFSGGFLHLYGVPYDSPEGWSVFSDDTPIQLSTSCTAKDFCLHHVSQAVPGWGETALLGELDKWVPMSPQRVTSITVTSDDVTAVLSGVPGETFDFWYILGTKEGAVTCKLDPRGEGSFRLDGYLGTAECS